MIVAQVRGSIRLPDSGPFFLNKLLEEGDMNMSSDAIASLIGDGKARITVSIGLDDKNFGFGATGHVSVSLSCNQDEATIKDAAGVARALAEEFVSDTLDSANEALQTKIDARKCERP